MNRYSHWPPKNGIFSGGSIGEVNVEEIVSSLSALTLNTIITPEINFEDFPKVLNLGDYLDYIPSVTGSDVIFSLQNQPSGMTIDESTGRITYSANTISDFNGIILNYQNEYHNESIIFSIKTLEPWDYKDKMIEYFDSFNYTTGNKGWKYSNTNKKGFSSDFVSKRPVIHDNVFGGLDLPFFDGDDDMLEDRRGVLENTSIKSGVILFKPTDETQSLQQIFGNYDLGVHLSLENSNKINKGFSFNGGADDGKGRIQHISDNVILSEFSNDTQDTQWKLNDWNKMYFEFETSKVLEDKMYLGANMKNNGRESDYYKGYVVFLALFNQDLTQEEINNINLWIYNRYGI